MRKNYSPSSQTSGRHRTLNSVDIVNFANAMPTRSQPLLFLPEADYDPVDVHTTARSESQVPSHALHDHRSGTHSAGSNPLRAAHKQQLFTFDDAEPGSAVAADAPGTTKQVTGTISQPFSGAVESGSVGSRHRAMEGTVPAKPALSVPQWKAKRRPSGQPLFDLIAEDEPVAQIPPPVELTPVAKPIVVGSAHGEKQKARDILQAVRILKSLDDDHRQATDDERATLAKFGGFGPVARQLFPDPIKGNYRDASWEALGSELESLLSPAEYESAKRTTFNAFYTSPAVIAAMHESLGRLGVPDQALILEPGCGSGNFMNMAPDGKRFIGVELDTTSGRIARALNPEHDIRIENFRDTKLPENRIDAVIGNVPFANIKLDHKGERYSLHDYFFAKSMDALKPGGVLALVTSHFTLDKQNASIREYLADQADFVGAIRLPADAFKQEGTKVVTDIVFLRKRAKGEAPNHVDADWLKTGAKDVDGTPVTVSQYFINHPEMVLGDWTLENQLYGDEGYSIKSNGDLSEQLRIATGRLPAANAILPTRLEAEPVPARFTRPPPSRHIGEGSFFIGDDRVIYQVEGGTSQPVMHGSTILKSDGTMMSRRLAALIGLRDAARLVLQSQNEAWPDSERQATRKSLNQLYDRFVSAYGPINKTTFSETKDGTVIRRMPNLVKFREDPDAMLVSSLEEYDEVTGTATKATIFGKDVVGRTKPIDHVSSAEEGLIVSLDQTGGIDLALIASLYCKDQKQILQELGDLIYLNPETRCYETADVYLSGNVRHKLQLAEAAGPEFAGNVEKLKLVQPPDILPGDIDANLGAPWVPATDIESFAAELFQVNPGAIRIGHLKKDAVWSVDANYAADQSVAATSDYGTTRIKGPQLLELALNMRTPLIYDTVKTSEGEERILNQEETLAAKEKQKLIKERFRNWIFSDPERTERLVRIYNDTYNNLRPRLFDGSHLAFSGMNETISLRQHQKDAIWRAMSSGNTLLAHAVGAGKTFTMAATGMKLKQAGLIKKPMFVVPNHMLEQFSREFMQLYPNAKLLVASKDDMGKDRRKFLTAKIASGDWDGIIVTHSSFERIGMSKEYQERFLREQVAEYEELLKDVSRGDGKQQNRNLIKTIEKQKANRENKLKELSAEEKKDDGLVFDELGVDHIFVDEAHYFKNLETATKMDRVAGIQTGGSQRSFDLYMKSRYLDELHPGHGVTFATGTPISNTMVEMYNMQRFLDLNGLLERGIEHFDAWAANFGEVVESMEISPDGASLRPRSRFARFNNLPELQQMFRMFADVQTADMLDLPRPKLKGGKPQTVATAMTDAQAAIQQELVERYERLRSQKIDPRVDNALAITTDGRKLALDARMLDPNAPDDPHSKLNALVENVARVWKESSPTRGTQLIFCDMGVHKTPRGFSAYDEITRKLIARGIPKDQIASIGEAESDAKKQAMFEKVRNGSIRVLIGSTQKMGTGTNVQKRLVALHHADAPWKPAEVEQRDGRIMRQGNLNPEVEIFRYVTAGSFDSFMWQALETKAKFISQIMTGSTGARHADDVGGQELSYAEVKAIASGNPAVLTLAETDAELQRLSILRKNHSDEQYLARRKLKELPDTIDRLSECVEKLKADQATLKANELEPIVIAGKRSMIESQNAMLAEQLERLPLEVNNPMRRYLGEYHGLPFGIHLHPHLAPEIFLEGGITRFASVTREPGARAVFNALRRLEDSYPEQEGKAEAELSLAQKQLIDYQGKIGKEFQFGAYADSLRSLRDELKIALSDKHLAEGEVRRATFEIVAEIESQKDSVQKPELERSDVELPVSTAEEPIIRQLQRRLDSRHDLLGNTEHDHNNELVDIEQMRLPPKCFQQRLSQPVKKDRSIA